MSLHDPTSDAKTEGTSTPNGRWQFARPLLVEAGGLLLVYMILSAFASATNLGRPGSSYPGVVLFVAVAGGLMAYHQSMAHRVVCFTALLLALFSMNSEKTAREDFQHWKYRRQMEQMQRDFEHLAEQAAKAEENRPTATP